LQVVVCLRRLAQYKLKQYRVKGCEELRLFARRL
jgi:hypothetical protein